jgi:hypothetical protein
LSILDPTACAVVICTSYSTDCPGMDQDRHD